MAACRSATVTRAVGRDVPVRFERQGRLTTTRVSRAVRRAHAAGAARRGRGSRRRAACPGTAAALALLALAHPAIPKRFIIFCISENCLTRRLTSDGVVPEPLAMRVRRVPLISCGCARSSASSSG